MAPPEVEYTLIIDTNDNLVSRTEFSISLYVIQVVKIERCGESKMRCALMTCFGDFVVEHNGSLSRAELTPVAIPANLYWFEFESNFDLAAKFDAFLIRKQTTPHAIMLPGVGEVTLEFDPVSGEVSFKNDRHYLCAQPDGQLVCNRPQRLLWETFLIVSEESVQQLFELLRRRWVVKSSRRLITPGEIRLTSGPTLVCGEVKLPLRYNLPFEQRSFPFSFPIYVDGWRIDELVLYEPLAFYIGKGPDTIKELVMSLDSLIHIGKFDGKLFVYTDASREEIQSVIPGFPPQNLFVVDHVADDWLGFVSGRFSILTEAVAAQCAPVAYFDTDILFNAPCERMFIDMVCAGKPTAAIEHFSKLAVWPSVGSELLQQDNVLISGGAGFNFGTFGIPNLKDYGHILRAIRAVLKNYVDIHGRGSLYWLDQAAANYVSYMYAAFDTAELTRHIRFGWQSDAFRLGALTGLVHFFGIPRKQRLEPMRHYLGLLKAHYELIS